MTNTPDLEAYPARSTDKLRYCDTDRQGHVNNAVFSTFLETGRVEVLFTTEGELADPGSAFVIARLELDFLGEIRWPGTVDIGTAVLDTGRSSLTLEQLVCQNGQPVALAKTVIVQMNDTTRKSQPLSDRVVEQLQKYRKQVVSA
ncbi:thioesterase family protein [uncultured Roseibium sp.]|uniref:acyl-CoA thioesterase n=1 Tax=uncultured Roseibium sp. TaxID=1936171 RepID=UPI0032175B4E